MLCGSSIYILKEQYHSFKLGRHGNYYFIHAIFRESYHSRKEYPVQLFPFRHSPTVVMTGIIDTDMSDMTEITFVAARDLLGHREGPLNDFMVVDDWSRRFIMGVSATTKMRVVICENIGRDTELGPISPEKLQSIKGYNMRRTSEGWDLRCFCFHDIYQEYYEWRNPRYDYLPYAVQKGPNHILMVILKKDGFISFDCRVNYVAMVNLELKRVTTAQAPVKRKSINDRVYPFEEFMNDVYIPWKKSLENKKGEIR